MSEEGKKPGVSLEDLLQLKRAERPQAGFWEHFDKELRAKQLAALVQPVRPWWHGFFGRKILVRVYAPLGAAAVVALSLSLNQHPAVQQVAVVQPASPVAPVVAPQADTPSASARTESAMTHVVAAPVEAPIVAEIDAQRVDESVATSKDSVVEPDRLLIAGAATVKAAGQALAQAVGLVDSGPAKSDQAQLNAVEPLTQVSTPRDSRRSRLLAYSVAYDPHAAGSQDSARSRDRIARHISDESIYDSISRLGVSGDRVSIKF